MLHTTATTITTTTTSI